MTAPEDRSELEQLRRENKKLNEDIRFLIEENKRAWKRNIISAVVIIMMVMARSAERKRSSSPKWMSAETYIPAELVPADVPQEMESSDETSETTSKSPEKHWCSRFGIPFKYYQRWKKYQMAQQ